MAIGFFIFFVCQTRVWQQGVQQCAEAFAMLSKSLTVILLLALLVVGKYSSASDKSRDVILHLTFVDEISFTTRNSQVMDQMLAERYPDARIISLSSKANRNGYLTDWGAQRARRRLLEKLQQLRLQENESIKMLILSTHGDTKDNSTVLAHVGNITSAGLDDDAKEFFFPLKGKMNPSGRVVLESCSTMCGTESAAAQRSQNLLRFLGLDRGSLFGATTAIVQTDGMSVTWKMKAFVGLMSISTAGILTVTETLTNVFQGMPPSWAGPDLETSKIQLGLHLLGYTAIAASVLTYTVYNKMRPARYERQEMQGELNSGLLFESTNDGAIEIASVKYHLDRDKIFGNASASTCGALLSNGK